MRKLTARLRLKLLRWRSTLRSTACVETLRADGATIGERVFLGNRTYVDEGFAWLIEIEDDVTVAPNAMVLAHDAGPKQALGVTRVGPVRIRRGAYIGAGAIVLPGVTIGEQAIVGAGSVVTRDVAPRTVVAGVPAQLLDTADSLVERHRPAVSAARAAGACDWTRSERLDPEGRAEIRDRALSAGRAYVE
jgi:maltose O-acetyltransferase